MFYEENLELHFWNGKKYDNGSVTNFLKYLFEKQKDIIEYKLTYINFNINSEEITDDIYERNRIVKIFNKFDIIEDNELINILENNFIESINFKHINNVETYFFIHYAQGYIYYSYEFSVENINNKDLFFKIKDLYLDLINIFRPKVSNGGFEVVWEDIDRIKMEGFFEGIFGYLSNEYKFDFIKIDEKINIEHGYLFIKDLK